MAVNTPFPVFRTTGDEKRDLETYIEDLTDYCIMQNWFDPSKETDAQKWTKPDKAMACLRAPLSPEARTVYKYSLGLNETDLKKPHCVVAALKVYYGASIRVSGERQKFLRLLQNENESIASWETRIRNQAAQCEYEDFADELMRDQFIAGLTSDALRVKLIGKGHKHKDTEQTKVTLREVVEAAKTFEATMVANQLIKPAWDTQQEQVNTQQEQVNFTSKSTSVNPRPEQQFSQCFWCGGNHQQPRQRHCTAFGKRCAKCGITGHFARVCRGGSRRRQGRQQQSNFVDDDNGEEAFVADCETPPQFARKYFAHLHLVQVDLKAASLVADVVMWGTKDFQVPKYFNFADVIDEWAQNEKEGTRKSDYPVLWWVDGVGNEVKWSFQDVAIKSKKTASILSTAADIKPGDHVMVILPTIPEYWLMQAACLRTGGVLIITPVNIGPKELHRRILKSKPVCVVTAPCDQIKNELIDVVNQITSSGQIEVRSRIVINRMKDENWEGWQSFEDLFETASADFQSVKSLSSAPTNIFFTSGTSGNAKMVEHCHASMGLGSTGMRQCRFAETDFIWACSSTGWSWLLSDSFYSTWSVGAGAFAHYKKVTAREFLETIQKYPLTQCTADHSMYMKALNEEDLKSFRFPTLKLCFGGGEPSNKQVLRKWKNVTGVELWDYYGQTEIGNLTMSREPGDNAHMVSAGKAFPGVDMLVVDDNYQEVPLGTLGRVVIRVKPYRPVGLFTRYKDDPEKTAACYSGDFYITGDMGRMDAKGYFWITGRADEMLINWDTSLLVNPYEVEENLKEHPAVMECAVVSSPRLNKQAIRAFVMLSPCFRHKDQDEMIKELQDHLKYNAAAWLCPDKMEFVEDLPKTIVGKINRRELANREWSAE